MDLLPSNHLVVFEKTVAFHNINHRQAKYVGPHLAHDGLRVKSFRKLL